MESTASETRFDVNICSDPLFEQRQPFLRLQPDVCLPAASAMAVAMSCGLPPAGAGNAFVMTAMAMS
jgi:hypothetical protein